MHGAHYSKSRKCCSLLYCFGTHAYIYSSASIVLHGRGLNHYTNSVYELINAICVTTIDVS